MHEDVYNGFLGFEWKIAFGKRMFLGYAFAKINRH